MSGKADRARGYCWTLNNYTPEDIVHIKSIACQYMVYGKEVGDSGTKHLQGYIYFENNKTFSATQKTFKPCSPHLEVAKGNPTQASAYCKKDGDFYETGDMPKAQGSRSDIDQVRDLINEGKSMREIVQVATSYQSVKMAECILKYTEKPRSWKPEVLWFYGATGTGKSREAYEILGEDCYTCLSTGRWFDGYDGHENVLIDDMRKDFLKFHELLRLLDRYAFRIETKGGSRQFVAKKIIITSAYHPEDLYETREDVQQLIRRIDEIKLFKN